MKLYQVVILGIVEGLTEFLPISSTGHLILTSKILGLTQTEFVKTFQITIQVGAILAVLVLNFKTLCNFKTLSKIIIAFLPTAVVGVLVYKFVKKNLLNNYTIILISLFLGGLLIIIFETFYQKLFKSQNKPQISIKNALIIGLVQTIAFIPGISRSLATILGGLALGINRKTIVEFSFLLAIPTILGATVFDLAKTAFSFSLIELKYILVGFFISFLVAIFALKFFLNYIQKNNFLIFGIYRIFISFLFYLTKCII
ncbi:MAG: undecaprenyl-diphosphate phosphatase [Candidatus Omnitrophica bacterium]|nr:undecaprenyl-diphosphate phosphatase [Candidatus Omnitrophota bacterium]